MKIKLHNSLSKVHKKNCFLFDNKISIYVCQNKVRIRYHKNDELFLAYLSLNDNELKTDFGFGINTYRKDAWWKMYLWNWQEMSE